MKCPICGKDTPITYGYPMECDHSTENLIEEIERLKPFEERNNETLDHIKEWIKPILGTEVAPMEEEDIRYVKELLEVKSE